MKLIEDAIQSGKWTTQIIHIPNRVLQSNNEIVSRYLRGIFDADGTIATNQISNKNSKYICIRLLKKNIAFLQDIKWLLYRFGIYSQIHKGKKRSVLHIKDTLSIQLFKRQIGFSNMQKMNKLKVIPKHISKRRIFGDLELTRVVSVMPIKKKCKVFNIAVPNTNKYFANGFLVHNCDCRMALSKRNRIISSVLLRSRKVELDFVATAQSYRQMDIRWRNVCDFLTIPTILEKRNICDVLIVSPQTFQPQHRFKFYIPAVTPYYDTREILQFDYDEDYRRNLREKMQIQKEVQDEFGIEDGITPEKEVDKILSRSKKSARKADRAYFEEHNIDPTDTDPILEEDVKLVQTEDEDKNGNANTYD